METEKMYMNIKLTFLFLLDFLDSHMYVSSPVVSVTSVLVGNILYHDYKVIVYISHIINV
jgi:hypothetical protein